ncbi:undecaprenyl-diphosphatase UppP [Thermomicrobium roseum]|uniref:Undecaprenyl-diphosphatase n=1 Tax=Thermomicrobium roseum (strain ATCC 27502 / DSM 5159 / P-2) TaxID=309801 RepID=UPPP_THERP|nr:undecaprenyl-diphosphatase UppP [Thermomicrobium roseum]B9KYE6.1 RecName: Full=Undecaprenyl-diphosphatase; AltName: Full=Bacitracin resistance protein; AltName: Full=Undecaprenyl pyrophosphate phosphatase [Thermomicrobium roseum DSM 5159]ACM06101.1 putative undecaprenol kinase [Thermomicrobium roseum DSM 5159]
MNVWQAAVLGIVQGTTEFLPISSSAHLIVLPWLFDWPEPGLAFNVALHLGTLSAVLAYFWRDLIQIGRAWFAGLIRLRPLEDSASRLGWAVIIGSLPAGLAGFFLNDVIDHFFHSGGGGDTAIVFTSLLLIVLGFVLWLAERYGTRWRSLGELGLRDGLVVGLAQALALLPGVSRSGSTITASLFLGFARPAAARFSFILGIPAIAGAGLLETLKLVETGLPAEQRVLFVTGVASAAITGFLAIAFLLRFLQRYSTSIFIVYRIALGLVLLLVVSFAR